MSQMKLSQVKMSLAEMSSHLKTSVSMSVVSAKDRKTIMAEKRKTMDNKRMTLGMRTTYNSILLMQSDSQTGSAFSSMSKRHMEDMTFVDVTFIDDVGRIPTNYVPQYKVVFDDDRDPFHEPNFKHHKIPLQIRCLEMYISNRKEYARQSKREIRCLIDNQPNAESAWQFVRTMAYTTLWPPLHSGKELKIFENQFCKLPPNEQRRYDKIMATNFT